MKKRNKRSTMDMACCIIKQKAQQALLAEFKIRVNNERNISANDLRQKIKYSKEILSKD